MCCLQPLAQGRREVVSAKGAALFAEQGAGLQRLQQGLKYRGEAIGQTRPVLRACPEARTQITPAHPVVFKGLERVLKGPEHRARAAIG